MHCMIHQHFNLNKKPLYLKDCQVESVAPEFQEEEKIIKP